jgi:hypothetical protein
MDDTELYAVIWRCVAAVAMTTIASVAGCTAHENYVQTEVLAKAINPAAVQCAFGDSQEKNSPFCIEVAKH